MMMAAIKHKKPNQHNRIGDSKAPTISLLSNSADDFYQATLTPSFSHLSFSKLLDGEISDEELNALCSEATTCCDTSGYDTERMDQHTGLVVACTAAALDANTAALTEPLFFVNTDNPSVFLPDPTPVAASDVSEDVSVPFQSVALPRSDGPATGNCTSSAVDAAMVARSRSNSASTNTSTSTGSTPLPIITDYVPIAPKTKRPWASENDAPSESKQLLKKARPITIASSCGVKVGPVSSKSKPVRRGSTVSTSVGHNAEGNIHQDDVTVQKLTQEQVEAQTQRLLVPSISNGNVLGEMFDPEITDASSEISLEESQATSTAEKASVLLRPVVKSESQLEGAHQETCASVSTCSSSTCSKEITKLIAAAEEAATKRVVITDAPAMPRSELKSLPPAEKAKICRDRNRIHARNTRLRKKAYMDELKRIINDLVEKRDEQQALEERQVKIVKQNKDVRFMVMQNFIKLHAMGEASVHRWKTILKDNVQFTLAHPSKTRGDASSGEQHVQGVEDVMNCAAGYIKAVQDICDDPDLTIAYKCDRKSLIMDGSTVVVKIEAKAITKAASPFDAGNSASKTINMPGSLRATFCVQTNKIQSAHLLVDSGGLFQQSS